MNGRERCHVRTGLDRAAEEGLRLPGRVRIGLLCNNATVDRRYRGTIQILSRLPGVQVDRIFSPQHGFAGEKQDNMVESRDGIHPASGIPLISLYGSVREPSPEMLAGLDALVIDLPDVGTRVYTFLSTALLCLRACERTGTHAVILDRPNPIGGTAVEGPLLDPAYSSFVGMIPVPLRHGLTPGEYCRLGAHLMGLQVDLEVVPLQGWERQALQPETDVPWVMPSPNLPAWESALVYPGMVLLEGTNVSEGRGTTRPFELWGAPWLDPSRIRAALEEEDPNGTEDPVPGGAGLRRAWGRPALEGAVLREAAFQPTFHKFAGQTVRGYQIHVIDPRLFHPVAAAFTLIAAVRRAHPDAFAWRQPPYEYEADRLPIDLILGTDRPRQALESGVPARQIIESWRAGEEDFREVRRPLLLYPEPAGGGA